MRAAREPLTSRIVTITGSGVRAPQNVEVPIGTPIAELIELCGGYTDDVVRLIAGGSMMGYALPDDDVPTTKATNCIIAATSDEVRIDPHEWPCIRCGDCALVCPSRLLPQDLLVAATTSDLRRTRDARPARLYRVRLLRRHLSVADHADGTLSHREAGRRGARARVRHDAGTRVADAVRPTHRASRSAARQRARHHAARAVRVASRRRCATLGSSAPACSSTSR